jgi:hypothetical protein
MKIIWTPNPLASIVELDEHDRQILWHRLKIEQLEERIGQANFDLNPETREWHNKNIKDRSLDEAVASALKNLDVEHIEERLNADLQEYVDELASKHSGDCTCVPCSCLKCHVESLLGVDTIPGLGKHEASYIDSAFRPLDKDMPERTIDQALQYLRDYHPVKGEGGGWEKATEEEFQRHVPRWTEEAKRAYVWLTNYQKEHSL